MKWNKRYMGILMSIMMTSSLLTGCGGASMSKDTGFVARENMVEATEEPAPEAMDQSTTAMGPTYEEEGIYTDEEQYTQKRITGQGEPNSESYSELIENDFMNTKENEVSTFSIDVDTASYANVRRFINQGTLPVADAVRIEELINYFNYDYPNPKGDVPFSITEEMMPCPWNEAHQLLLVGLKGKTLLPEEIPPSNLVFLIDVSGSMNEENKLPLLKESFSILTSNLKASDTVSIVVYAGSSGVVLDGAEGNDERAIKDAFRRLAAGGSTAGAEGIERAYQLAESHFIEGGNNRVIIATDGDFNVGPSSLEELEAIITKKAKKGIFLTTLGFGMGNYKDDMMETLADKGNGNYAYIDSLDEAQKVLGEEMYGTLYAIAKDVKIQVEFNPSKVESYRLIGYENRVLAKEDFDNDAVDAGEIGAGHHVTALYEIQTVDANREEKQNYYEDTDILKGEEYGLVKLRYKEPDEEESKLLFCMFKPQKNENNSNIGFASAVAEYGMLLRDSKYKKDASYDNVLKRVATYMGDDPYKQEFMDMVYETKKLTKNLD